MMKNKLSLLILILSVSAFSQKKCYVQAITDDVYGQKDVEVEVRPSYKILKKIPPEYKKVEKVVVVQEAYEKKVLVPEVWENKTVSFNKKDKSKIIHLKEVVFKDSTYQIITKSEQAKWELIKDSLNCKSLEEDCENWKYIQYPSEYRYIPIKTIDESADYTEHIVPETVSVYNVKVLKEQAKIETIEVPAVYDTIVKYQLIKDAYVVEEVVPAEYETHLETVLLEKGGTTYLKEIDCSLVTSYELKMDWGLKSAVLTNEAKLVIENKLIPFIKNNPNVKIEISSHTDERGPEDLNLNLSERRALAIVDYLVTIGVKKELLIAVGYGKSSPIYDCEATNSCSDEQRSKNRRIEYKLAQVNSEK